jgi:hypothetical protein
MYSRGVAQDIHYPEWHFSLPSSIPAGKHLDGTFHQAMTAFILVLSNSLFIIRQSFDGT